jgi:hypothetical protein
MWLYLFGLFEAPTTLSYVGSHFHGQKKISKDKPHWKVVKAYAWQPPL